MTPGRGALTADAWRDAARAALQGGAAAAATFLAMRHLGMAELLVGILSAVFILQPSIGGTLRSAISRLVATLVGTLAGLAALLALPDVAGTVAALAFSVFIVSGVAALRPDWTYGLVAAVGVSLAYEEAAMDTALDRAAAIALGAGIGLLSALVLWPERAHTRREKHFRRAVRAVRDRVDDAVATAVGEGGPGANRIAPRYYREMALAREADRYARLRGGDGDPRLRALRRLYNATIIVDRADEALAGFPDRIGDLDAPLREVRQGLVAVLDRILDGQRGAGPPLLPRIDAALAGLAAQAVHIGPENEVLRTRVALVFGLVELRTSLGDLLETLDGPVPAKGPPDP